MENKTVPIPPEGQLLIYHDGAMRVQVRVDGKTVWLTQRLMAELYQVSVKTVNEHLINIYAKGELDPEATVRKFRIVQIEGLRQLSRMVEHYNLNATLAVGYGRRNLTPSSSSTNAIFLLMLAKSRRRWPKNAPRPSLRNMKRNGLGRKQRHQPAISICLCRRPDN